MNRFDDVAWGAGSGGADVERRWTLALHYTALTRLLGTVHAGAFHPSAELDASRKPAKASEAQRTAGVSRSSSRAALPVTHRAPRDLAERHTTPRHLLEEALAGFSKPPAELDAWMQWALHCRSVLSCLACDSSGTAVVGVDALVARGSWSSGHCAPAALQGGASWPPFKPSVERDAVHRWAQPVPSKVSL